MMSAELFEKSAPCWRKPSSSLHLQQKNSRKTTVASGWRWRTNGCLARVFASSVNWPCAWVRVCTYLDGHSDVVKRRRWDAFIWVRTRASKSGGRSSGRSCGRQLRGWRSGLHPCRGWRGVDQYVKIESDATHPAPPPLQTSTVARSGWGYRGSIDWFVTHASFSSTHEGTIPTVRPAISKSQTLWLKLPH